MNLSRVLIAAALFTGLLPGAAQMARAQDFARLTLSSEPGNFIGQGGSFDITYDTARGDTVSPQIRRRLGDGSPADLLFVLNRPSTPQNEFALVFFGTSALGIPIQPGFYPEARRADFAPPGFAGLDISFQNRGSNQVFGSFTIFEVTFSPDRQRVQTFDAEFLQRSESPTSPALRGRFQFNIIPEPSTSVLLGAALLPLTVVALRRGTGMRRRGLKVPRFL